MTLRRLCCLLLLASAAGAAAAADDPVGELQAAGRLQVDSYLAPTGALVPGQKATLTLAIATDRWFSGGTRIAIPEVAGLVIVQTEQFASNASETRDGQSWVVQRWHLDVYPQRAGEFSMPQVALAVKVNTAERGDVEGTLYSPPVRFSVSLPDSLEQAGHWVASPLFTVSQQFDRALEGLQVGDAFEREILFEADDVMAMMLPAFTADQIPGLAAYPSPPLLDNSSNRGQIRARRSQRISYVVEAEGDYLLPGHDFFWWDTQRGELLLLSLPATPLTVGAGSGAGAEPTVLAKMGPLLLPAAGLILLGALAWLVRGRLPGRPLAALRALGLKLLRPLLALRRPALPRRLNPGGSAGE